MTEIRDFQTERVLGHQTRIAERLHSLAIEIERMTPSEHSSHPLSSLAGDIVHAVTWGTANLNLSILIEAAADSEWMKTHV